MTAYHVGDFDLNGRVDLLLEWITGGNGAAASGGAIYEIGIWDDDLWHVREMLYSDTSVTAADLDRDGLWEFAVADEYWGLAAAHAWAARYYARIYKPDTRRGGYDLANRELSGPLRRLARPAEMRRRELLRQYEGDPGPEVARDLAAAWGEYLAWQIARLNESSLQQLRYDPPREFIQRLIRDLELPIGTVLSGTGISRVGGVESLIPA